MFSHSENSFALFYKANIHCWILQLWRLFRYFKYCQFVQQLPIQFWSIFVLSYFMYLYYNSTIYQVFDEEEVESGHSVSNVLLVRIFDTNTVTLIWDYLGLSVTQKFVSMNCELRNLKIKAFFTKFSAFFLINKQKTSILLPLIWNFSRLGRWILHFSKAVRQRDIGPHFKAKYISHTSCKQNLNVTKSPKIHLFQQFNIWVTVDKSIWPNQIFIATI